MLLKKTGMRFIPTAECARLIPLGNRKKYIPAYKEEPRVEMQIYLLVLQVTKETIMCCHLTIQFADEGSKLFQVRQLKFQLFARNIIQKQENGVIAYLLYHILLKCL